MPHDCADQSEGEAAGCWGTSLQRHAIARGHGMAARGT